MLTFFVISGFYMGLVLNEEYVGNTRGFYVARILRLLPVYLVLLIPVSLVRPLHIPADSLLVQLYSYATYIVLFGVDTLNLFGLDLQGRVVWLSNYKGVDGVVSVSHLTKMPHMWSIGVELWFYLIAPLFVRRLWLVLLLLVLAYAGHVWMTLNLDDFHPLIRRNPLNFLWLFLLGVTAYHLWRAMRERLDQWTLSPWLVSLLGVGVAWAAVFYAQKHWVYWQSLHSDPAMMVFALALVPIFHYTKDFKLGNWMGEMSYPIYVVHWPIVMWMITGYRGDVLWGALLMVLSFAAAVALHYSVERPVNKLRVSCSQPDGLQQLWNRLLRVFRRGKQTTLPISID